MKQFLAEIFVWWHGQTWGTRLWLWRFTKQVGTDEFGNTYWHDAKSDRRFVTYNGPAEASRIPSGWHGWMHHRTNVLPSDSGYKAKAWEKSHVPNMTGTSAAYVPDGSMLGKGERPRVSSDYDAWSPE